MQRVKLDGDVIIFRVMVNGFYEDRIFVRDETQPIVNNVWKPVQFYRDFVNLQNAK